MENGGLEKVVNMASSEINVGFKKGTSYQDAEKLMSEKGYKIVKRYDPKRWDEHDIFRTMTVEVKKGGAISACKELEKEKVVRYAEPNYQVHVAKKKGRD